jgi:DNA polymerase III subunit beta
MQISIPRASLLAVAVSAAVKDVRFYLKSVFIEVFPDEVRLTATDGATLASIRVASKNNIAEKFTVMVPTEIVKLIKASGPDAIYLSLDDGRYTLLDGNQAFGFAPVDGRFPDYRRAIPASVSGESGFYQPDLIARFDKIRKTLKIPNAMTFVRQNGPKDAALVQFAGFENFIGVVMPMHETEKCKCPAIPTWPHSTL